MSVAADRRQRFFFLLALPAGRASVHWLGSGLFLLAPAIAYNGSDLSSAQIGQLFTIRTVVSSMAYIPAGLIGDISLGWALVFSAILAFSVAGVMGAIPLNRKSIKPAAATE